MHSFAKMKHGYFFYKRERGWVTHFRNIRLHFEVKSGKKLKKSAEYKPEIKS